MKRSVLTVLAILAGATALATTAQAAPGAPALAPGAFGQPVQYYPGHEHRDWRRAEWERREAHERWRRHEEWRRWHHHERGWQQRGW